MSDSEETVDRMEDDGDEDLFGAEGDTGGVSPREAPSDIGEDDVSAPGSRDDSDGLAHDDEGAPSHEIRGKIVIEQPTYRHKTPKARDGILRILRVPKFIKFMPEVYEPETFLPTDFDVVNTTASQQKHVVRVRRDPETGELKSNTNMLRWSDGSVTLSVGGEQYEVQKKMLAAPHGMPYNKLQDGHFYAAAAELSSNLLLSVGHLTEQYNVKPNKAVGDDALSLFAERMAQASQGIKGEDMIVRTTRDPELQKKMAEEAEKERLKAQRRRENAAAKMDGGLDRSGRGMLTVSDLEGRGPGAGRKRGAQGSGKARRRRPEYDSDDDLPQGVTRHENYDMDDGFLVGSDEEEMVSGADDEEEEEIEYMLDDDGGGGGVGGRENGRRANKRQRSSEMERDEDAERDEVEPLAETLSRTKRRNVIDDDDE